MTDPNAKLPPALRRALELLAESTAKPDVSKGYLDLLGTESDSGVPKNTGAIQALWASPVGSLLYDNAQAVSRRLLAAWQHPIEWLNIPPGGISLDVGCGPGSVTPSLARAAGPDGLALASTSPNPCWRAVRAESGPQAEMARVLRPGGRFALMVPTVGRAARFWRMLPNVGAHLFGDDEIGDILEDHGLVGVRTKSFGTVQWVRAKRA